jgi:hypothetical protein
MIRRLIILSAIAITAASAQSKWPNGLTATFRDGVQLVVHTESTAAKSPLSTTGSVAVNEGNDMHRLVLDRSGHILFGYTIEAWGVPNAREHYFVRIKPLDSGYETRLRNDPDFRKKPPVGPDGKIATVAAVRDFPSVRKGEAVSVDILMNPATGERIYDVLEPSTTLEEPAKPPVKPSEDEFSFKGVKIVVNGRTVHEPNDTSVIGASGAIYIPGHGTFYLAVEPLTGFNFLPSGRVNREKLTFGEGNDWVEVTGKGNILSKSEHRTIWVYHTPTFQGQQFSDVMVATADSISYLIPKPKKSGKEE